MEATNAATGLVRSAVTGADGYYSLPLLQPGDYTVKATLRASSRRAGEGIASRSAIRARVDMKLTVGGVDETVTVSARRRSSRRRTRRSASSSTTRRWSTCR